MRWSLYYIQQLVHQSYHFILYKNLQDQKIHQNLHTKKRSEYYRNIHVIPHLVNVTKAILLISFRSALLWINLFFELLRIFFISISDNGAFYKEVWWILQYSNIHKVVVNIMSTIRLLKYWFIHRMWWI